MKTEVRDLNGLGIEVRATEGKVTTLQGYAALFNVRRELPWMQMREQIATGAFANALTKADPRALFNHDVNRVLGRKSAGTLEIYEDSRGLRDVIHVPKAVWVQDLIESIQRGDVRGQSIRFVVKKDVWTSEPDGWVLRTIVEMDDLFDVGPVTEPAYEDTSIMARSLEEFIKELPIGRDIAETKRLREQLDRLTAIK